MKLLGVVAGIFWGCLVLGSPVKPIVEIVGGNDAVKDAFPWQVLMKYEGVSLCGGSIINERTILTAAHCVEDDPKQKSGRFSIVAGEFDTSVIEGTEQELFVAQIKMHKRYDYYELYNDIALLILDGALTYTQSVQPVPLLANKKLDPQVIGSSSCVVTGWGIFNDTSGASPFILQQLTSTNIVSHSDCKAAVGGITKKMICALDDKAGFCNGDSGGPMGCFDGNGIFNQVGVVSWGPSKKCAKGKQVYTRVSKYRKWIRKKSA